MTYQRVAGPAKWHGGKAHLASRIVALMPPHTHYVEPFAGGLAVLLAKDPEGVSEVVNDADKDLTNFWQVLQGLESFAAFRRLCEATPFSQAEWRAADAELAEFPEPDPQVSCRVVRAWRFFVHVRQSLAGRRRCFAPLSRSRTRRGMNEQASAWLSAVEGLGAVHARLRRVAVLCGDAVAVIRSQDGPGTLFYCDPPYLAETRAAPDVYRHEMTDDAHRLLVDTLATLEGRAMVSMYRHPVYDRLREAHGWTRHDFDCANHAAGGAAKRRMTECVWCNF